MLGSQICQLQLGSQLWHQLRVSHLVKFSGTVGRRITVNKREVDEFKSDVFVQVYKLLEIATTFDELLLVITTAKPDVNKV